MTESEQMSAALRRYEKLKRVRHKWTFDAGKTWCLRCNHVLRPGDDAEGMCDASRRGRLDFSKPHRIFQTPNGTRARQVHGATNEQTPDD